MSLKDQYFTVSQAAEKLGVTRQTLSRWINAGEISSEKVGRERLIPKKEVHSFMLKGETIRLVWRIWERLEKFLGHRIEKIVIEPYLGWEVIHAMVISKKGKVDYFQIWERQGEKDSFEFQKLKKSDWSFSEHIQPHIEIYIGVSKDDKIIATYKKHDET